MIAELLTSFITGSVKNRNDITRIAVREREMSGTIVEIDLVSRDYFHFRMNMYLICNKAVDVIIVILLFLSLIMLAANDITYTLIFSGIAVFCLLWLIMISAITSTSYTNNKKVKLGFSETGLFTNDNISYLRIPWKNILVKETSNYYFMYYAPFAGFIIPKQNMLRWGKGMINSYIHRFTLKKKKIFRKYK